MPIESTPRPGFHNGRVMTPNTLRLLLNPAIALMNRMTFSKKFLLLGLVTLTAVCITIYSLYSSLNQTISDSQSELEGLKIIRPLIKAVQLVQQHRGLSSGLLSGIKGLEVVHAEKSLDVDGAFSSLETHLSGNIKQYKSWKSIASEWRRIQSHGLQWSRDENFTVHTQLVDELLRFESVIADDYGLTGEANLDAFYLVITASNDLLNALEHLGQMRAYGTGILGERNASEEQLLQLNTLITQLKHTLSPLKINIEKSAIYNPSLRGSLLEVYANVESTSEKVITAVVQNIMNRQFTIAPGDFFNMTTKSINSGYDELYKSLLPTAENLIQSRIKHYRFILQLTISSALLLLLLMIYFMGAIYYATLGNINILTHAVLGFVRGDMRGRVHLSTQDELSAIGDGFNTMADDLAKLIAERQDALDLLTKIAHSVPGVVYQYRQRVDGCSSFPFASEGIREIYHVSPEEVREDASRAFTAIYPADFDGLVASIQASAQNLTLWHHEYRVKFDDGTVKWLLGNAMPEREMDGATLWHGFITDVTTRKSTEAKVRLLSTAVEQSPASVVITDINANIEYVNPRFTKVTGFSQDDAAGQNPRVLQSGLTDKSVHLELWDNLIQGKSWVGEFVNKRKNGETYFEEAYISPVKEDDGTVNHYVAVKLDITARKRLEVEVHQLAYYDTLTNLPNRRMLNDRLGQTIASTRRSRVYGALMFLDLDNFKPINDTHGHIVGDMLLTEAANRLKCCVRETDTVARFGGDEFVVMLAGLDQDKAASIVHANIVAEKIRTALSEVYVFTITHDTQPDATVEHRCTGSIGVVMFNGSDGSQEDIMKWADVAMYEAKDAGRNQIRFFGAKD